MYVICWTTFQQLSPPRGGGNPVRVASKSVDGVVSNLLPKFENFSGQVKDGFKFIEEFKMKSVGMTEPKQMATFIALGGIATALWFERISFPHGPNWKTPSKRPGVQS